MSTISNNALTQDSWKNYQEKYDQIDWTDKRLDLLTYIEGRAKQKREQLHDHSLRTPV